MTRRGFLAAIGAGGLASLAGIDALWLEPKGVEVTRHRVGPTPSSDSRRLRLVQLTDLHLQGIGEHEEDVARKVNELAPDLIVITGDSVDRADRLGVLAEFLDLLDPAVPRYAVPGNWEYAAGVDRNQLARTLESRNGRLLINESVIHDFDGRALRLTGLDDLVAGRPDLERAVRGADPGPGHVLLVHCPAYRDRLLGTNGLCTEPDLILSGHTHGGQVTVFGWWAPVLPPGSGGYVSGWYRNPGPPLYVSRGIGTTAIPVRFCAPPEIAVFDWSAV